MTFYERQLENPTIITSKKVSIFNGSIQDSVHSKEHESALIAKYCKLILKIARYLWSDISDSRQVSKIITQMALARFHALLGILNVPSDLCLNQR